jgi:hypothetical protein
LNFLRNLDEATSDIRTPNKVTNRVTSARIASMDQSEVVLLIDWLACKGAARVTRKTANSRRRRSACEAIPRRHVIGYMLVPRVRKQWWTEQFKLGKS